MLSVADFVYLPFHTLGNLSNSVASAENLNLGKLYPVCAKTFGNTFCSAFADDSIDEESCEECPGPTMTENSTTVYSELSPFGTTTKEVCLPCAICNEDTDAEEDDVENSSNVTEKESSCCCPGLLTCSETLDVISLPSL